MAASSKSQGKILVVDDESRVREIIARKLTDSGHHCLTAANGSSALKAMKADQVDLVLLDIIMPGKSGTEVLQEITNKYPETAVIMVTAVADVQTAIGLLKAGAYDYIIKPIDLNVLLLSINRALEKRNLLLENKEYQDHLEQKIKEQTEKVRQSFLNSTTSLVNALEAKDKYTHGHSQRVTKIAVAIGKELTIPRYMLEKIELAGLLHDVGKIGVSEAILNKPGRLSFDEFELVKSHPEIGERILIPIVEDKEILEMVRHHHERFDGNGYPDGLSGKQITQASKIMAIAEAYATILSPGALSLAVADAYDAMTSDRPYRPAMSPEAACAELTKGKGKQFDPTIVDIFLALLEKHAKL